MITDTDRINALEKMGNIAVWHGSWATHVPVKGGKQIRSISELDDDGTEVGEELVRGETIREAIDNYLANASAMASADEQTPPKETTL